MKFGSCFGSLKMYQFLLNSPIFVNMLRFRRNIISNSSSWRVFKTSMIPEWNTGPTFSMHVFCDVIVENFTRSSNRIYSFSVILTSMIQLRKSARINQIPSKTNILTPKQWIKPKISSMMKILFIDAIMLWQFHKRHTLSSQMILPVLH